VRRYAAVADVWYLEPQEMQPGVGLCTLESS
jgi:hypothetical protein